MAFSTPVLLTSRFDQANTATLVLPDAGTITLTAGRLYLLLLAVHRSAVPTLASGYTILHDAVDKTADWAFIIQTDTFRADARRAGAYWLIPPSTETAIVLSFDSEGGTNSCHMGAIYEIASGFHLTAPIANSAQAVVSSALFLDVPLGATPTAGNLGLSVFCSGGFTSVTDPRSGWTETSDDIGTGAASDSGSFETQYKTDLADELTASSSVAADPRDWGGIHLEIAADAAVPAVDVSGTVTAGTTEADVVASGKTIVVTLTGGAEWVPA